MTRRPAEITILSLYLLVVFSLSVIGSLYGAAKSLAPYATAEWLILMIPKVSAIAAGIALWRMLRIGAWLWGAGVAIGWALAVSMGTGFFPNLTVASVVSLVIVAISIWILARNWNRLRPLKMEAAE